MSAVGKLALWEHQAQASARGRSSRGPVREHRAISEQSGEADGLGTHCQPGSTECSSPVQHAHLGGEPLQLASLGMCLCHLKGYEPSLFIQMPPVRLRRLVSLFHSPPLPSILPPPAQVHLPPVSCARLIIKSSSSESTF